MSISWPSDFDESEIIDLLGRPAWYDNAACKSFKKELFFVEGRNSNLNLQAKLICLDCPVRLECLEVGMEEYFGVFGGTSAIDRARLRRAVRRGQSIKRWLQALDERTRKRATLRKYKRPRSMDDIVYD